MIDTRTIDELKELGSGRPAPDAVARFYHQAFAEFGTHALWNWRELHPPTITQALAIANSLRTEGDRAARALVVKIEEACPLLRLFFVRRAARTNHYGYLSDERQRDL